MREYDSEFVANRINGAGGWHAPGSSNVTYIYINARDVDINL